MRKIIFILLFICACVKVGAQVNIITTICGDGSPTGGYCCDSELAINAKLNYPESLWLDKFNNIYIADAFNDRIRKIDNATGIITTIAGCCDTVGFGGDSGLAVNANFFIPEAVIVDTIGNIYIADAGNNRIRKIEASTGIITTIAGSGHAGIGAGGYSGDNGPATSATLNCPSGLCFDNDGNILIADNRNNRIRKVNIITGIITTIAGTGVMGYTGNNGLAINAEINQPGQVFVDSANNVFFSDYGNEVIRKISASTGIITTIAGNGITGYAGDSGLAIHAEFYMPMGLFIDQQQNIFIADDHNGAVRKIDASTGIITTVAGIGVPGYSGDHGPATSAKVVPTDIYFDNAGNMFIADAGNNCIRKVNNALEVTTISLQEEIKIYPNPTQNELNISGVQQNTSYRLLTITGASVQEGYFTPGNHTISMQNIPSAVYILELVGADGRREMVRVVKE